MASFTECLPVEIASVRYALIVAYENKDRLLYMEAPALRQEYMEKVGYFEEQVLKAELDNTLLERKVELIQAAINRREPVDEDKINAELEVLRKQLLDKADADAPVKSDLPALSAEEQDELQRLYKEIIKDFHPSMHPHLTETQRELYEKALDAYKRQSLEALRTVYTMLMDESTADIPMQLVMGKSDANAEAQALAVELTTDYTLASLIWECFEPLESEMLLMGAKEQFAAQLGEVSAEIERIMGSFPFSAKAMLRDPRKTEKYMEELRVRLRRCEREKLELAEKIDLKMSEAADYA